jgi:ketopantoate reductase
VLTLGIVVRTPEEATVTATGFDYVILCVKALPDVYDLGSIIESVVTPQNTCIVVNTTTCLGIEAYLESRYPTNIVLSLVAGANINQLGPSEFEHTNNSDVWLGSTNQNPTIPLSIQLDMAETLALTLASGQVECHVSLNIRQEQWERMMG